MWGTRRRSERRDVVLLAIHAVMFVAELALSLVVGLVANIICLTGIAKHRDGEVHMRASWVFSKNDVLANLGIVASGVLVMTTGSRAPDLVMTPRSSLLVMRGGVHIVGDARGEHAEEA